MRSYLLPLIKPIRFAFVEIACMEDFPEDLCGLCCRASASVFNALEKVGMRPTICFSYNHCWVECNNFIIDITSSQFPDTPPMIVRNKRWMSKASRYYHKEAEYDNLKDARKWQRQVDWFLIERIKEYDEYEFLSRRNNVLKQSSSRLGGGQHQRSSR